MRSVVQLGGSVLLLARMHPLLVLLPVFRRRLGEGPGARPAPPHGALKATAEDARHRQELVTLASSAAAGKEVRLFGLREDLVARHRVVAARIAERRNRAGA